METRVNGALTKMSAARESILRTSFLRDGSDLDQTMRAIIEDDSYWSKAVWGAKADSRSKAVWGARATQIIN